MEKVLADNKHYQYWFFSKPAWVGKGEYRDYWYLNIDTTVLPNIYTPEFNQVKMRLD